MIPVVLEDQDFLIVEKPAGIATQPLRVGVRSPRPGRGNPAPTLADLIADNFPEIRSVGGPDWGAVHRLDRETSGLVVFARNQETYEALRGAFSRNEVEKEYTALVEGIIEKPGRINWPIGPDPKSAKKVKVYRSVAEARRNKAQEAVTIYEPVGAIPNGTASAARRVAPTTLLRILIKTGRRHQIRVHLAAIGHPIVGDSLYGGPKADRMYLHASRLSFRCPPRHPSRRHPQEERWVEAVSPTSFAGSPS
jgi:23S rRNA pseudouridine1911/1915/1917 synthase